MIDEMAELLNFEDETPHADERWLVSYADMMTLLFGFFVMLYSMMHKMDVVQKSVAGKFKPSGIEVEQNLPDAAAPVMVPENQKDALLSKMAALQTALHDEKGHFSELQKVNEQLEKRVASLSQAALEVKALKEERDGLRSQMAKKAMDGVGGPLAAAAPAPVAAPAEPPSGFGGGGNRGARERRNGSGGVQLRLEVRSTDGSFASTTKGVTNKGFSLDHVPPTELGETFIATVTGLDGKKISVVLRPQVNDDGSRSQSVGILHYLSGNERILRQWIADAPN